MSKDEYFPWFHESYESSFNRMKSSKNYIHDFIKKNDIKDGE